MSDINGIKLDYEMIGKILKSNTVMDLCNQYAQQRVQPDEHIKSFVGFDRCHAFIYPNIERGNR